MKKRTKTNKADRNDGVRHELKRVHFEFTSPSAESVAIAGTFNDWQPSATPMIELGKGRWAKDLALPPGDYEYFLVVDGYKWMPDPLAGDYVPNPFGGTNAIRRVGNGG